MEVIKDKSGHYIKFNCGRPERVSNINIAKKFDNGKAQIYIDNQIGKSQRSNYIVEHVQEVQETQQAQDKSSNEKQQVQETVKETSKSLNNTQKEPVIDKSPVVEHQTSKYDEFHLGKMASIKSLNVSEVVNNFTQFFQQVSSNKQLCEECLRHIEDEICDIEHAIEFYNFNACTGFKLCKILKDLREQRRFLKDEIYKLSVVKESSIEDWRSGVVKQRVCNMKKREYMPRVMKDLFVRLKNKEKI